MTPVVMVTPYIAHRERPVAGDIALHLGHGDDFTLALLDHLQRVCCECARGAWAKHPNNVEWMEKETGRKGWRAYLEQDTAHLIHVIEELGIATFEMAEEAMEAAE